MEMSRASGFGLGLGALLLAAACDDGAPSPVAPVSGAADGQEASAVNMRLVGMDALQGRPSYQAVIREWRGRWLLFAGHHGGKELNPLTGEVEANGLSIVDVSDPAAPVYLAHLPATGEGISDTRQLQVCAGSELPGGDPERLYLLRTNGQVSIEIQDVSDPAAPALLSTVFETGHTVDGRRQTHKSLWDCATGIGYLEGTVDGWRVPRVLRIFDLSDPAAPKFIRDFGVDGMQPGSGEGDLPATGAHQPMAVGNRVYLGYGAGTNGIMQILDRDKLLHGDSGAADPFAPTAENLKYPEIARLDMPTYWGSHTVKPIYGMEIADYADDHEGRKRDILIVPSEAEKDRCLEPRHAVFFIDATQEDKPFPISSFQVPEEPGDYCNKGGRFGPHSVHDSFEPHFLKTVAMITYFNAGIRAVDIRDPFHPVEIGHFIPEVTEMTKPTCTMVDGTESCATVIQSNNAEVDARGYIYLLDRAGTGLHILALTGKARDIVGLPVEGP